MMEIGVASGKLTVHYGKSPFLMGKCTISMTIFNNDKVMMNSPASNVSPVTTV